MSTAVQLTDDEVLAIREVVAWARLHLLDQHLQAGLRLLAVHEGRQEADCFAVGCWERDVEEAVRLGERAELLREHFGDPDVQRAAGGQAHGR